MSMIYQQLIALEMHESHRLMQPTPIKYTRIPGGFIVTQGEPGGRSFLPMSEVLADEPKAKPKRRTRSKGASAKTTES